MFKRQSLHDKWFDVFNYAGLIGIAIVVMYPLIFIVSASFSSPEAVNQGLVWLWPKGFSLKGYERIFASEAIWRGYGNTILYTAVGVTINLFMTITAAYALSRKHFMIRRFVSVLFVFTMFFGGGLIPTYLLVKNLGMLDSIWALVIPNAVSMFQIIITRTFFETSIPDELRESAMIDGCSDIKYLLRIVVPLSMPIIAVLAIFYGVDHWNSYFSALIYMSEQSTYPLQLVLRQILIQNQISGEIMGLDDVYLAAEKQQIADLMKFGIIIVSSLPIIMVYPFLQRYFVKGMMIGAIKG
ncbi:carbohydrate ABC transporter permease [Paenibacillus contaminans]|uniref:Carbohydrate ABC transporter permease n=1 Tax=Paenibacillus contaminans TaxID=450362 RepID=A0A329MQW6_9BACL|nr:carbohydrate ABC transporter permease [Paenibacillus contaminans]RAV22339.1 carbohydrate ABC transporter permease [Paenibacillus contaminans]